MLSLAQHKPGSLLILINMSVQSSGRPNLFIAISGMVNSNVNPQPAGGGGNWPIENQNSYISETKCPIDLNPGCKFEFVRCVKVYLKRLIILGHEGTLQGPFLPRVP